MTIGGLLGLDRQTKTTAWQLHGRSASNFPPNQIDDVRQCCLTNGSSAMQITRGMLDEAASKGILAEGQAQVLRTYLLNRDIETPSFRPAHILY